MNKTVVVIKLDERGYAKITRLTRCKGQWVAGVSVITDELTPFERDLIKRHRTTLKPVILPLGENK